MAGDAPRKVIVRASWCRLRHGFSFRHLDQFNYEAKARHQKAHGLRSNATAGVGTSLKAACRSSFSAPRPVGDQIGNVIQKIGPLCQQLRDWVLVPERCDNFIADTRSSQKTDDKSASSSKTSLLRSIKHRLDPPVSFVGMEKIGLMKLHPRQPFFAGPCLLWRSLIRAYSSASSIALPVSKKALALIAATGKRPKTASFRLPSSRQVL